MCYYNTELCSNSLLFQINLDFQIAIGVFLSVIHCISYPERTVCLPSVNQ